MRLLMLSALNIEQRYAEFLGGHLCQALAVDILFSTRYCTKCMRSRAASLLCLHRLLRWALIRDPSA